MSTDPLRGVEGLREPQRLSDQLAVRLAAEIVSERISVGQAFPSAEDIVTRFNVSRTVARETVQALAMLGLVYVQHGKRTEVCPAEDWDILSSVVQEALRREGKAEPLLRDLYEFRILIEPQAAAWMAQHGSERDLDRLEELAVTMEELSEHAVAIADVMAADRSFHNLVARASENRVLAAVSRDIREVLGTLWGFSSLNAEDARVVAAQHRLIADAIRQRDGAAAAEAMRTHMRWAAQADLHGLGEPAELRVLVAGA